MAETREQRRLRATSLAGFKVTDPDGAQLVVDKDGQPLRFDKPAKPAKPPTPPNA